jgi:hypothetical protein
MPPPHLLAGRQIVNNGNRLPPDWEDRVANEARLESWLAENQAAFEQIDLEEFDDIEKDIPIRHDGDVGSVPQVDWVSPNCQSGTPRLTPDGILLTPRPTTAGRVRILVPVWENSVATSRPSRTSQNPPKRTRSNRARAQVQVQAHAKKEPSSGVDRSDPDRASPADSGIPDFDFAPSLRWMPPADVPLPVSPACSPSHDSGCDCPPLPASPVSEKPEDRGGRRIATSSISSSRWRWRWCGGSE